MATQIYKILWIDDEHEKMSSFKATALRYDLELVPFKSVNGGMEELKRNLPKYDGVLFDAKILEDETNATGTESTRYVHRAKSSLDGLSKKFDTFIFTGQAKAYDNETFAEAFGSENIYQKGVETERTRLFENLRRSAAGQEDAHIRNKYAATLAVCTDEYLGNITLEPVGNLLKALERDDLNAAHLNQIRNVVERAMDVLQGNGLMPYEITKLNAQSRFLDGFETNSSDRSGKPSFTLHEDNLPPKYITNLLRSLVETTQEGSHAKKLDDYLKSLPTTYWPKATMYQLLAFIEWFKSYIDSQPRVNNWRIR